MGTLCCYLTGILCIIWLWMWVDLFCFCNTEIKSKGVKGGRIFPITNGQTSLKNVKKCLTSLASYIKLFLRHKVIKNTSNWLSQQTGFRFFGDFRNFPIECKSDVKKNNDNFEVARKNCLEIRRAEKC